MANQVNWVQFERKLKGKRLLLFSPRDVMRVLDVSKTAATFLVHRYTKRGYLARVKRGLYGFGDALPPDSYIANKLYEPSYLSLEFALSYHGVIPETVYEITSVTPKSTRRFEVLGKVFSYRTIKQEAFTGYVIQKQRGFSFQIAEPEKAFVDTLYLRKRQGRAGFDRIRLERLDQKKVVRYAALFNDAVLTKTIESQFV